MTEVTLLRAGARPILRFERHLPRSIDPLPGTVLEWDPPHRARFTWGTDTIGFELAPAPDGGTIFVLTEELSANAAARNAAGWGSCLDRLQHGQEREQWKDRFDRYTAELAPVLGHQDGPPAGYHDTAP
jgi:uncharacterized protein YndB with AHSA1/START domain